MQTHQLIMCGSLNGKKLGKLVSRLSKSYDSNEGIRWVEAFEYYEHKVPCWGSLANLLGTNDLSRCTETVVTDNRRNEEVTAGKRTHAEVGNDASPSRRSKMTKTKVPEIDLESDDDLEAPLQNTRAFTAPTEETKRGQVSIETPKETGKPQQELGTGQSPETVRARQPPDALLNGGEENRNLSNRPSEDTTELPKDSASKGTSPGSDPKAGPQGMRTGLRSRPNQVEGLEDILEEGEINEIEDFMAGRNEIESPEGQAVKGPEPPDAKSADVRVVQGPEALEDARAEGDAAQGPELQGSDQQGPDLQGRGKTETDAAKGSKPLSSEIVNGEETCGQEQQNESSDKGTAGKVIQVVKGKDCSRAEENFVDIETQRAFGWPDGVQEITEDGVRLTPRAVAPFYVYPNAYNSEESMELGLKLIVSDTIYPVEEENRCDLVCYPDPYLLNVRRDILRVSSLVSWHRKWSTKYGDPFDKEWFGVVFFDKDRFHYQFMVVRNIPCLFQELSSRLKLDVPFPKEYDLCNTMNLEEPQVLLIDSYSTVTAEGLDKLLVLVEVLLVLFIHLQRRETGNIFPRADAPIFKEAVRRMKYYLRAMAVKVTGPLQEDGTRCGFFAMAHCTKAKEKGYLSEMCTKAKRSGRSKFPNKKGVQATMGKKKGKLPRCNQQSLFKDQFIADISSQVLEYSLKVIDKYREEEHQKGQAAFAEKFLSGD